MVDTETFFQNAILIKDKTAERFWNYFIACWESVYTWFTEVTSSSAEFRANEEELGIDVQVSGM